MFKMVSILIFGALAFCAEAQIVRQESTNELKKAVYTVDLAGCPHKTVEYNDEYNHSVDYWAMVHVPELKLANNPSIELRKPASGEPSGWTTGMDSDLAVISEQMIYLWWKQEYTCDGQMHYNYGLTNAVIIVIYESNYQADLKVLNTGTGKSLALEWSTNAPNAKVEGYKVYRRVSAE